MILYHGSSEIIKKPSPFIGRKNVDFGQGFYLTDLREQAVRWAKRRKRISLQKKGVLNVYEYAENADLKIKEFCGYCEEWLDFALLDDLVYSEPNNQYAFKTVLSLNYLKFIKYEEF
jgi:hypothetical protein